MPTHCSRARLPVTALCFKSDESIAAGAGSALSLWSVVRRAPLLEGLQVLKCSTVHGLFCCDKSGAVFVYGGRELAKVRLDGDCQFGEVVGTAMMPDRIILVHPCEGTLLVVLAHGQVLRVDSEGLGILQKTALPEDYLVYSAAVVMSTGCETMIALGTVFHGIEVFRLDDGRLELCCRLKGHEGSVFDLAFDAETQRLASASDDRTVRVWNLNSGGTRGGRDKVAPEEVAAELVLTGHRSRVWRVLWSGGFLISSAEDSTLRIWSVNSGRDRGGECTGVFAGHVGLNVWCMAARGSLLVSGGDDCSVRLWDFDGISLSAAQTTTVPTTSAEPKSFEILLPFPFPLPRHDPCLLIHFSDGSISPVPANGGIRCQIPSKAIERSAVIKYSVSSGVLLAGSLDGVLYLQRDSHVQRIDLGLESRVVLLSSWEVEGFLVVLVQAGNSAASFVKIDTGSLHTSFQTVKGKLGMFCCAAFDPEERCIMIGTRDGRLLAVRDYMSPELSLVVQVSKEAVTCMRTLPGSEILMTDRSGHLSRYSVDCKISQAQRTGHYRISKGWLEQVDVLPDGTIQVAGFEGTNFFIYNFSESCEVLRLPTGGAHRFWKLEFTGSRFVFAFIRLGKIHVLDSACGNAGRAESTAVVRPLHGAEIRSVISLGNGRVLTGGEDGRLCVVRVGPAIDVLSSLLAHRSGIKSICRAGDLIFTGGSGGELMCWRLSGDVLCAQSLPRMMKSTNCSRIMGVDCMLLDGRVMVAAAYSDSYVRIWEWKGQHDGGFAAVSEIAAHQDHCCICVRFLTLDGGAYLASCGTDGRLVLTSLVPQATRSTATSPSLSSPPLPLSVSLQVHQSGVNSLSIRVVDGTSAHVATGGDDGKIAVSHLSVKDASIDLTVACEDSRHHLSTVTSVRWSGGGVLWSASVDKRLVQWRFEQESGTLCPLSVTRCQASDVGDLAVTEDGCVVVGAGIEVIDPTPLEINL